MRNAERTAWTFTSAFLLLAVAVAAACGGGGGGPSLPKSPTPDDTTIVAIFDDQTMQFGMGSGVNAVEPFAEVHVYDPGGETIVVQATGDGAFEVQHAMVPPGFVIAPGTVLAVTQTASGMGESLAVYVTIQLP